MGGRSEKEEMKNVSGIRKFMLLSLTVTKIKGNGEVSWYGLTRVSVSA